MHIYSDTFQDAFLAINSTVIRVGHHQPSRLGDMHELLNISYSVSNPRTYIFRDKSIGRLNYHYITAFYEWMVAGCTDEASSKFLGLFPQAEKWLQKPDVPGMPANFNTLYGPRIVAQMPAIEAELLNENSRRAVIMILQPCDHSLLPIETPLEYPCTISMTLNVRHNTLYSHLHMRSQNTAQVMKLDMYLWARFMCELADRLDFKIGDFTSSIVSAHIYAKDLEYISELVKENS